MTGRTGPSGPPPKPTRSGMHPAVREYRAKLDSIDQKLTAKTDELDRLLSEFLVDLKTPIPEPPKQKQKPPPFPRRRK